MTETKMRSWLPAIVLAAAPILSCAPVEAQQRPSRNCSDDRGVDRCAPEQHRRVLELFSMKPIEEHQRAGDQVRRVFYVSGYGRDVVAIAFIRSLGKDPMLWVHYPKVEGEAAVPPATALVPATVWDRVLSRSQHFDKNLVGDEEVAPASDTITLCLHSWVYTVEATDPAIGHVRSRTRREVEDACEDGLGEAYAIELAELALPLLPYCAALDPDLHRWEASQLGACAALEGDRLSAARAYDVALKLANVDRPVDRERAGELFEYNAKLTWDEPRSEALKATEDWMAVVTGDDRANFYISRVFGETGYRATIYGGLVRDVGERESRVTFVAPVTLVVSGTDTSDPQIASGTIGAFARLER